VGGGTAEDPAGGFGGSLGIIMNHIGLLAMKKSTQYRRDADQRRAQVSSSLWNFFLKRGYHQVLGEKIPAAFSIT
jgi:hypothetical protein